MHKIKEKEKKQGLFQGISEWQRLFGDMDKHIRLFDAYCWNAYTTKENLTKKRDETLKMVKSLDNIDLHVLYISIIYGDSIKIPYWICGKNST